MRLRILLFCLVTVFAAQAWAAEVKQLTKGDAAVSDVRLSADGRTALFMLNREDKLGGDVAVMDLTTGAITNLTIDDHPDAIFSEVKGGLQFSPCGKWVYYAKEKALWKVPVKGGKAEKVFEDELLLGFLVARDRPEVLLVVYELTPINGGTEQVLAPYFFVRNLKTGAQKKLETDFFPADGYMEWLPDGRIITIGLVGDRSIVAMDMKGRVRRLGPALFHSFPAFLNGGKSLVFVEQVFRGRGKGFEYHLPTWTAPDLLKGEKLELPVPEGTEVGSMWSVPGYRDLIVAVGKYDDGYKLYRYSGETKKLTLIVDRVFGTADEGAVAPDGSFIIFQGGKPGVSRGPLMKVSL